MAKRRRDEVIKTDSNHCQIVRDALRGKRGDDKQAFDSLAILGERLDRLKRFNGLFSGVGFSTAVRKLVEQNKTGRKGLR